MIHTALWLAPSPLSLPLSLPGWPEFLKISPLEDRVVAMIWKFSDFLACFQNRPCTTPYRMLTKILMMMMVKTSKTQLSFTNIHVPCAQKCPARTYSKDTNWIPSGVSVWFVSREISTCWTIGIFADCFLRNLLSVQNSKMLFHYFISLSFPPPDF